MSQIQNFALADPRTMDGDPFDVAQRATQQAAGVSRILGDAIQGAATMARNAALERQLMGGEPPDPSAWMASAEGRRFQALQDQAAEIHQQLNLLARAAGFNPKAPLGKT